ncbi:hypothetical protein LT330_007901 [Penicillium expansum]|nr:hypothetical protein LT330_007901 [Penicillium expansum]KGO40495.1 hypothetical protein PEX1_080250 [Penicillium expansum]
MDNELSSDSSSASAEMKPGDHSQTFCPPSLNSSTLFENTSGSGSGSFHTTQLSGPAIQRDYDPIFFNSFDWHLSEQDSRGGSPPSMSMPTDIHLSQDMNNSPSTVGFGNVSSQPKGNLVHNKKASHGVPLMRSSGVVDGSWVPNSIIHTSTVPAPTPNGKPWPTHTVESTASFMTPSSASIPQDPKPVVVPQDRSKCSCLTTAVFLLDELEDSSDPGMHEERKQLDSHLSSFREILSQCESMLQCLQCRHRPENMTVLNLVLERQTSLSDGIVNAYLTLTSSAAAAAASDSTAFTREKHVVTQSTLAPAEKARITSKATEPPTPVTTVASPPPERPEMLLGDYSIAESEWTTMVRVLILTQLLAFDRLVAQMMRIPSLAQRDSQMKRLRASELRNQRLKRQLWPDLSESSPLSDLEFHFISSSRLD